MPYDLHVCNRHWKKALSTGFLKIKVWGKCIIQWEVISVKKTPRTTNQKPKCPLPPKPSNQETFCLLRIPVPKGTNHLMMCLFLHSSHASQLNRAVFVGLRRTQRVNVCKPSSMAALEREGHTPLKCQHQRKPKHISLPEPPKKDNFLKTELLLLLCLCKLLINRTETRRNRKKPKTVKQWRNNDNTSGHKTD